MLIGAATGSCVAAALVALVLFVWHRYRTVLLARMLGPKGHRRGGSGRPPGSSTCKQAASPVLPMTALRAGSLPLRVRASCTHKPTAADTRPILTLVL